MHPLAEPKKRSLLDAVGNDAGRHQKQVMGRCWQPLEDRRQAIARRFGLQPCHWACLYQHWTCLCLQPFQQQTRSKTWPVTCESFLQLVHQHGCCMHAIGAACNWWHRQRSTKREQNRQQAFGVLALEHEEDGRSAKGGTLCACVSHCLRRATHLCVGGRGGGAKVHGWQRHGLTCPDCCMAC